MKTILTPVLSLLLSSSVMASSALDDIVPSDMKVEGVTLLRSATARVDAKETKITRAAHALRRKKVALFWAKVSLIEMFAPKPQELNRNSGEAFADGLIGQNVFGLRLTFVRNVTASQTGEAIRAGLRANGVDPESAMMKPVLTAVENAGEGREGKSLWVVGVSDGSGTEKAFIRGSNGKVQELTAQKGVLKNVLLIWLGKPADPGLEEAKQALLASRPAE